MRVVATAGHVDHGKSTLVRALTGRDPDRLAEERRRGVTIELGFAWTDLPSGTTVAFVDVPGHERFVPTMLAGTGQVGVVLFVVAADEGWMPQSAEHLDILRLLDVRHGVVALTRADLVDADTLEVAAALVGEELVGSPLAGAPIVPVSAVAGTGLDALRTALDDVLAAAPPPPDRGRARLWVDRAFSVRGAGTVVTGTLQGGALSVDDHLLVHPAGVTARVRGLHALDRPVARAHPGWRVAVNLVGVDVEQAARGSALAAPGTWLPATTAEVWATPSPGRTLGRRGAWTVHVGTAKVPAALHPVAGADLRGPGPLRVELSAPLLLAAGDRLVLRDAGPGGTAGGAVVLDPAPPAKPRGAEQRAAAVEALAAMAVASGLHVPEVGPAVAEGAGALAVGGPGSARVRALVERHGHLPTARALALADATPAEAADPAADLLAVGELLLPRARARLFEDLLVHAVVGVHQRRPALAAVERADARRLAESAGAPPALVDGLIDRLVAADRLEAVPGGVRVPGHEPRLTGVQQAARGALLDALADAGLAGLAADAALATLDGDRDLLAALVRDDQVVATPDHRVLARTVVDDAAARLAALGRPFTAADARDALGTSRRLVIPLLEVTDQLGLTTREGDHRVTR